MSELRRDLVSSDWIIIATERAKRPKFLGVKKDKRKASPIKKYPALVHIKGCALSFKRGPHLIKSGVGEHDLVITKSHYDNFADISLSHATEVFKILQKRYKMLAEDECNV